MLRSPRWPLVLVLAFLWGCESSSTTSAIDATAPAQSHGSHAAAPQGEQIGAPLFDGLGDNQFPITTASPEAQKYFDQGLILAYGFNHGEAGRSFREAARLDPQAPMPWWGAALVLGPNINKPMADEDVPAAWTALQRAKELSSNGTAKEQALIAALAKRYAPNTSAARSALDKAYADAMREVASQYPTDPDIQTLFAEALMDTIPWDYWTKDGQPKPETVEILQSLESVLAADPLHPGATHYYIHANESVRPQRALAAADNLRKLHPETGHLVHMPGHIYLRLGMYHDAALVNEDASATDEAYIASCRAQGFYPAAYYPHNVHFLWYATSMEGRSADSIAAARKVSANAQMHPGPEHARLIPLTVITLAHFGKWQEVLDEPQPQNPGPFEQAMWQYARGLAYVGQGEIDQAQEQLEQIRRTGDSPEIQQLEQAAFGMPARAMLKIAELDLAGQLDLRQKQYDKAVDLLRESVAVQDELPYMEPPYWYYPQRHALGAALLQAGRPAEAEQVYREDLKRNPNNGYALLGLEQSLRAQGKTAQADEVRPRYELAFSRADLAEAD